MTALAQDAIRIGPKVGIEADTGSAWMDLGVVVVLVVLVAALSVWMRRMAR